MDTNQLLKTAKQKFTQSVNHFEDEIKLVRTGRAHPSMLGNVTVEAYGQPMPLIQVGSITVPEPQLLQITPFDPSNLSAITAAIRDNQSLGLNPMDDGRVVRIPIPPLTAERRQQIVKQLSQKKEEAMIALRNIRHEVLKEAESAKNDKSLSQDDFQRFSKQLDEAMHDTKNQIEEKSTAKEKEILTI